MKIMDYLMERAVKRMMNNGVVTMMVGDKVVNKTEEKVRAHLVLNDFPSSRHIDAALPDVLEKIEELIKRLENLEERVKNGS